MIKLTVKGLNELVRKLQEEERNAVLAMTKAHSKVAADATAKLKRGLSFRANILPYSLVPNRNGLFSGVQDGVNILPYSLVPNRNCVCVTPSVAFNILPYSLVPNRNL